MSHNKTEVDKNASIIQKPWVQVCKHKHAYIQTHTHAYSHPRTYIHVVADIIIHQHTTIKAMQCAKLPKITQSTRFPQKAPIEFEKLTIINHVIIDDCKPIAEST